MDCIHDTVADGTSFRVLSVIDVSAAHCDACSPACSCTIRTARSRTSGENLLGLAMTPNLSRNGASGNPGAVQHRKLLAADQLWRIAPS